MFGAELTRMVVVPANTFDNVKGEFPTGFKVWWTAEGSAPSADCGGRGATALSKWPNADVYDKNGLPLGTKGIYLYDGDRFINDWVGTFGSNDETKASIGTLLAVANDSVTFAGTRIEGGWGVNANYVANPLAYIPLVGFNASHFANYTRDDLITSPLFTSFNDSRMASTNALNIVDYRLRAKMLGDAIPAESFAAGRNMIGGVSGNYGCCSVFCGCGNDILRRSSLLRGTILKMSRRMVSLISRGHCLCCV